MAHQRQATQGNSSLRAIPSIEYNGAWELSRRLAMASFEEHGATERNSAARLGGT